MRTVLKVWVLASFGILSIATGCKSDHDDGHTNHDMRSAIPAISVTR